MILIIVFGFNKCIEFRKNRWKKFGNVFQNFGFNISYDSVMIFKIKFNCYIMLFEF